ncbi:MAG: protein-L-isoaspartate(D-aspartate) O-methyltransferase [Phycisphaerae bacterium]|nr:protein-L-isoaspartate(D-aspartate) O-methyltransferase [Phycisphaerae bacterium]
MLERKNHDSLDQARERMLRHDLRGRDITDPEVLRVMAEVPREEFVPSEERWRAYGNGPLPIGEGQTISQPYIVALMTQVLRVNRDCEVLEVGTGSGYQTAVLARLAKRVFTIERSLDLSAAAQAVLKKLGIDNVEFRVGDGSCGWPEERTFDRIILTAAVPEFPQPLVAQLAEAGVIVAPVGQTSVQELVVAEKHHGKLIENHVCGCRFVRLIGQHGFFD